MRTQERQYAVQASCLSLVNKETPSLTGGHLERAGLKRPARAGTAVLLWLAGLLASSVALAQSYSIDWSTIDGGGGTGTNGQYCVSGTVGQPDASAMSGGSYSLTGGFWALYAVQMAGAPILTITLTGTNTVVISWPYPSTGFGLQENTALATTNWTSVATAPVQVGNQWQVTVSPTAEDKFYRLKQ